MENLRSLIEHTVNHLYNIIEIGRKAEAIHPDTIESITSTIDELSEIEPGEFPIFFCVSCGDDFEKEKNTKDAKDYPQEFQNEYAIYSQGMNEKDYIPESFCEGCLKSIKDHR